MGKRVRREMKCLRNLLMVDGRDDGGRGRGRCKGRMAGRRMRWITDESPSWDAGLDETWCGWLKGLGLWGSVDWT